MSQEAATPDNPSTDNLVLRLLLGLGLMFPALICLITGMVIPTVSTLNTSLLDWKGFGQGEFIGFENYTHLFSDKVFGQALNFTIMMIIVRLLIVAILPVLLALGVNAFGRAVRIPVRLAFTVPLALYTPVALALSWELAINNPAARFMRGEGILHNPATMRPTLLVIDGLFVLSLALGLGLIIYLAALRGQGDAPLTFKQARRPLLTVWTISLLATVALTLQAFDWSYILTKGGPINKTLTLALFQFGTAFNKFMFGYGAASMVPPLLVILVLGLAAGLIVVLAGLQLEHVSPTTSSPGGSKPVFGLILALALLFGMTGCLVSAGVIPAGIAGSTLKPGIFPEGMGIGDGGPQIAEALGTAFLSNTVILSALAVLLFQIPVTYLAAVGIGGLRPLGKRSEWLLLLFSPWLFMTTGPLMISFFERLRAAEMINTSAAVVEPSWISIPILFILTLLFKGCEKPYRKAIAEGQSPLGAFFKKVILPSLPLTLLLALAAVLVRMQRFHWPLVMTSSPDTWTMPVALTQLAIQYAMTPATIGQALSLFVIPTFLFFLVAFGIYQVVYLERLALCGPDGSAKVEEETQAEEIRETGTAEAPAG
ncbi:MAG: hypothetical protein JXB07_02485 [Anaerolineae bacterium]|nr:hypothetical protein [Anaerolineae bacterium]